MRDLPHNLVASFRATLEEATHADVLLIVLDVSDPAAELQLKTVRQTLDDLFEETAKLEAREGGEGGEGRWTPPETILLLNKVDRLADNRELLVWQQREPEAIPLCSLRGPDGEDGLGQDELRARTRRIALGDERDVVVAVPLAESRTVSLLEVQGAVTGREYVDGEVHLRLRIGERVLERLLAGGSRIRAVEGELPATGGLAAGWGRG